MGNGSLQKDEICQQNDNLIPSLLVMSNGLQNNSRMKSRAEWIRELVCQRRVAQQPLYAKFSHLAYASEISAEMATAVSPCVNLKLKKKLKSQLKNLTVN